MPIQFRCESCSQPIEVDDEGAGQWVACPFCSQTSRAPASSDPDIHFNVPVAPPQGGFEDDAVGNDGVPPTAVAETRRCKLGWIALACLGVCLLSLCVLMPVVFSALSGLGVNPDPAAVQKVTMNLQTTHPWTVVPNCLGTVMPVVALAMAIGSLARRESPRWPAIVALSVSAVMVVLVCLGFFMILATVSGT